MLDHVGLQVSDYRHSLAFYRQALAPLGVDLVMEMPGHAGFGPAGRPAFWLAAAATAGAPVHIAFTAASRELVDRFHEAALSAGGIDNGAPGLRTIYHPSYYGAFVLDPDGNNIEAVCHLPD